MAGGNNGRAAQRRGAVRMPRRFLVGPFSYFDLLMLVRVAAGAPAEFLRPRRENPPADF